MKERQIGNFEFWHNRLVMVKQAFDEADPKTVRQYVMVVASIIIKNANFEILLDFGPTAGNQFNGLIFGLLLRWLSS